MSFISDLLIYFIVKLKNELITVIIYCILYREIDLVAPPPGFAYPIATVSHIFSTFLCH